MVLGLKDLLQGMISCCVITHAHTHKRKEGRVEGTKERWKGKGTQGKFGGDGYVLVMVS